MKKEQEKLIRICKNLTLIPLNFILLILDIAYITNDNGILILLPFYIIPSVLFEILYLLFKSEVE